MAGRLQSIAHLRRTPILPDNRVTHRPTGLAVPHDRGFALIGDADRGDVARVQAGTANRLDCHSKLRGPNLQSIVLDPTRLRKDLPEFFLRDRARGSFIVKNNRAGAGGAFVEGQEMWHRSLVSERRSNRARLEQEAAASDQQSL